MKISCNVKQGTSLVKNNSQTVEIKDKTNEKKPYLEQNISNHKLDGSDKKANTNTSPEMKISCNVKQGTFIVKNSSQTVEIKDKTKEKKPYLEQNISNHKLDGSDLVLMLFVFLDYCLMRFSGCWLKNLESKEFFYKVVTFQTSTFIKFW